MGLDSRTSSARRSALWLRVGVATIEPFAAPLAMLITTPWLLDQVGAQGFAQFILMQTTTALGPLLSLGAAAAMMRLFAQFGGGQIERERAITLTRDGLGLLLVGTCSLALLGALASTWLTQSVFARMGEAGMVRSALLFGFVGALMQEVDNYFAAALRGCNRFVLAAALELGGRALWLAAVILAGTRGVEVACLAATLALALKAMLKGGAAAILFATPRVLMPTLHGPSLRLLLRSSRWLWLHAIGGALMQSVDRLLVGSLVGATALATYAACVQLAVFALSVPAAAGQTILPWVSSHLGRRTEPRHGWSFALLRLAAGCAAPGLILAACAYPVLYLWLGSDFAVAAWPILATLAICYAWIAASIPNHFMLLALDRPRWIGLTNLAAGVVSTSVALAVCPYGLIAFAFAKLFYPAVLCIYPKLLRYELSRTPI